MEKEIPTECESLRGPQGAAADVLEARFEEIFAAYERKLLAANSPLVTQAIPRGELKAQARAVLEDVAEHLRGQAPTEERDREDQLSASIGGARARGGVHPSESLRAVVALSEAALSVVVEALPPSATSRKEVAAVALAIQKSILERVLEASVSYVDYLITKLHESHAGERHRIGRELHDQVAHPILVVFRSLELCELYWERRDNLRVQEKLKLAKRTAQEALDTTRSLSSDLRNSSSAEEGLEVALSEHLRRITPPGVESWVSAKGEESLVSPDVRNELFLVLREAVNNALAHSGARKVTAEVDVTRERVRVAVEDDGLGFEPEEAAECADGTGLASMRERTSLLGGTLSLRSRPGYGTRVEVVVPLPRGRR